MVAMSEDRLLRGIRESAETVASLGGESRRILEICRATVQTLKSGGKILTAGNGGSAAEALHMAEELTGRFRTDRASLPAVSLAADSTALTCIGNDFGYDHVFSRQLEGLGNAGDMLVLFSTSGNAPNLMRALDVAREREMKTVCLLGRDGGPLAGKGDFEVVVAGSATERIQEAHQVLLHLILDAVELAWT